MSVLTFSSRFALLDEDTPSPAPVAKKVAAPVPQAPIPGAAKPKAAPRGEYAGRGAPRKVFSGDRDANTEGAAAGEGAKEDRANTYGGRGGARGGRGGARGGRGGANPRSNGGTYLGGDRPRRENGGGRPFDKHSQTAHKDSDKSEAQGWGAEEGKKELEAEVLGEADAKTELPVEGAAAVKKDEAAAYAPVEEEEDNTQTYEEYLVAQAATKLNIALPEARVANEGVDESQWASQTKLAKKGANEDDWFLGTQKVEAAKAKKVKEGKTYLEINARFPPPKRDGPVRAEGAARGGRGGRGGSRGRGEARGGARNGAPRAAAKPAQTISFDATAFPSLA